MTGIHVNDAVLDALFKRFGADKGKLLLRKLLGSMTESSDNLQQAYAAGDNTTMHRMVHNLKSACGNVGAEQARVMAIAMEGAIEDVMKKQQGAYAEQASIEQLVAELAHVQQYLQQRFDC